MHLDRSRHHHLHRRNNNKKEGILIKRFTGNPSKSKTSFSIISNNDSSSSSSADMHLGFIGESSIYDLELLTHCDGLIFDSNYAQGYSVVCNLATRETIFLPKPSSSNDSTCFFALGFGYDLKNHRYKAVRITGSPRDYGKTSYMISMFYNVEIYTLGAYSWRQVKNSKFNSMNSGQINSFRGSFYFNGAIHWKGWYPERLDSIDFVIILFNLGDEEFQMIQLPDDGKLFQDFLIGDGSLAVSVTHSNHSLLDIFVMKEYGVKESWTKVFAIEIGSFWYIRPLTIWEKNEILFQIVDNKDRLNYQLVSYNLRKQEFKNLQIQGCRKTSCFKAFVYMESLVSIKSRRKS